MGLLLFGLSLFQSHSNFCPGYRQDDPQRAGCEKKKTKQQVSPWLWASPKCFPEQVSRYSLALPAAHSLSPSLNDTKSNIYTHTHTPTPPTHPRLPTGIRHWTKKNTTAFIPTPGIQPQAMLTLMETLKPWLFLNDFWFGVFLMTQSSGAPDAEGNQIFFLSKKDKLCKS